MLKSVRWEFWRGKYCSDPCFLVKSECDQCIVHLIQIYMFLIVHELTAPITPFYVGLMLLFCVALLATNLGLFVSTCDTSFCGVSCTIGASWTPVCGLLPNSAC